MNQDIRAFVTPACELLGFGEPTHIEPRFGLVRNELFAQLLHRGFRSIALETDRVAAQKVDDFVRYGTGTLDQVMKEGFSHTFGDLHPNRELVEWMREHNEQQPEEDRISFHGWDLPTEATMAPSPRTYLELARDYLGLDHDIAALTQDDERWHRTEAVMNENDSIGDTAEARELALIADDMLIALHVHAPELRAKTSTKDWINVKTHLTGGINLLRYHRQCAVKGLDTNTRVSLLLGVRDAMMAQNLLEIREIEANRGPTFVHAANGHLQRTQVKWAPPGMDFRWNPAGAILSPQLGRRYVFIAGTIGKSDAMNLGEPAEDTFEGDLQSQITGWGLTKRPPTGRTRTDTTPQMGYFPLAQEYLDGADGILHIA